MIDAAPARTSIASVIESRSEHSPRRRAGRDSDRLVGTLVHRLLQRFGLGGPPVPKAVHEAATRLVRREEIDESGDVDALVEAAVSTYTAICARDDLRALYLAGKKLHEVPFTMAVDGRFFGGRVVSGTHARSVEAVRDGKADIASIDCVSFAGLRKYSPAVTRGIQVIGYSDPYPGLPLITSQQTSDAGLATLRAALAHAMLDTGLSETRKALFIGGFEAIELPAYQVCIEMRDRAVSLGCPSL